ncbi:MAG: rhomboid family intramembrane serine protease [Flavobacteriales bacterium]
MTTAHQHLTNIGNQPTDKQKIFDAILVSIFFMFICWIVFAFEHLLSYNLSSHGLRPRTVEGLAGIFSMHFLHGDFKHISHNTLGFLVLNTFLFYFYRDIAWKVFFYIFLFGPIMLWLVGRSSNHIGASLLIYGLFAFITVSGFIRKNPPLLRAAFVIIIYYGSLVWYLLPIEPRISFEGHISGFIAGLVCAIAFRKQGPQRKLYQYETEPELPDDETAFWKVPNANP